MTALLIGNTSGIGRAVTEKLLEREFSVIGISRSKSSITHNNYQHIIQDVSEPHYESCLKEIIKNQNEINLCIYFAAIGDEIDWEDLSAETSTFKVNLMSAVTTTEFILTKMLQQKNGHFIGISSIADSLTSPDAPSYSASKSGVSKFWEGLALGIKNKNVFISNIRFGFVDTKMAKSPIKPFLLSIEDASNFVLKTIYKPRIRATKPIAIIPLVLLLRIFTRLRILLKSAL